MLYLDYILYPVLLILGCILINNVFFKNQLNEGFEHEGKGFIAAKPKKVEDKEKPDGNLIKATKITYNIAEQLAYIFIKMPYQFLAKIVTRISIFTENINDLLKPIKSFINKMFQLGKRIFMKIFKKMMKNFKSGFNILGNLPDFLEKMFKKIINFVADVATRVISAFEKIFKVVETIINLIMELPFMIFDMFNQLIDIIVNTAMLVIKLPGKMLDIVISLQNQGLNLMDKSFNIPFMDLFFK